MPPVVVAAGITAAAAVGASAISASASGDAAEKQAESIAQTNQAQMAEADKNRAFQKEQSDTAHQREVKDLLAAGLNPILSANAGASTPSGSMAQLRAPYEGYADTMSRQYAETARSVSSAGAAVTDSMVNKAVIETQKSQAALNHANAAKAIAETVKTSQDTNVSTWKTGAWGKATGYMRSLLDTINPMNILKGFGTKN